MYSRYTAVLLTACTMRSSSSPTRRTTRNTLLLVSHLYDPINCSTTPYTVCLMFASKYLYTHTCLVRVLCMYRDFGYRHTYIDLCNRVVRIRNFAQCNRVLWIYKQILLYMQKGVGNDDSL